MATNDLPQLLARWQAAVVADPAPPQEEMHQLTIDTIAGLQAAITEYHVLQEERNAADADAAASAQLSAAAAFATIAQPPMLSNPRMLLRSSNMHIPKILTAVNALWRIVGQIDAIDLAEFLLGICLCFSWESADQVLRRYDLLLQQTA